MADKKYYVHAKLVVEFNFPVTATSKKWAIAELKESLQNKATGMSEGNPDGHDPRWLYAFDASEVDSHDEEY
tara:strand:+ start:903 stop:1118 length:216 start_codon:yes stop_codon:yes gene_type:complete